MRIKDRTGMQIYQRDFQVSPILLLPFCESESRYRVDLAMLVKDVRGRESDACHRGGADNCHD